jgi:hypothetical protein
MTKIPNGDDNMDKLNGGPEPQELARIDELVADFRTLRDWLDTQKKKYEEKIAPIIARKEEIGREMLAFLDQTGQESARTSQGTVTARVDRTASCSDPDEFMAFIRESGLLELLDRRPNKTACLAYLSEHNELPPGVKLDSIRNVSVRKPS